MVMMHVTYGHEEAHAELLRTGLTRLGPNFLAEICYWCKGTTHHAFEHCSVCGDRKPYGTALGLLVNGKPAPESVVNQVLVAGA